MLAQERARVVIVDLLKEQGKRTEAETNELGEGSAFVHRRAHRRADGIRCDSVNLEDIAYGVLYLASDESSFMTGSELVIDGGLTAQ